MNPARTTVALIAGALLLAGCSAGGAASSDPSSFADISGSAVPVADELTALCAQIVEQALPLEAAEALADSSGYTTRVGSIDGEEQAVTMDYREDRMTFATQDGIVTECTVG